MLGSQIQTSPMKHHVLLRTELKLNQDILWSGAGIFMQVICYSFHDHVSLTDCHVI